VPQAKPAWPGTAVEQIAYLKRAVEGRSMTPDEATALFDGARPDLVARHLETLALMGELREEPGGRYTAIPAAL
jgi:hypothetical protein